MFDPTNGAWVPESLDEMEPGHELGCVLSAINVDDCSPHDRIRVLRAHQRQVSFHSAHLYQAMNAVVDVVDSDDIGEDFVEQAAAAEVAAALRLTRRAADIELEFALELRRRLPQVSHALFAGRIDPRRAKIIANNTAHLPIGIAQNVTNSIIEDAGRMTTGQLGARLRKLCIEANPEHAKQQYEHALADRRISMEPDVSGTAHLHALDVVPDRLAAVMARINKIAEGLRRPGETRTIDQLRADVLMDLLLGSGVGTGTAEGHNVIHTTLESLAKLTETPGDLAGYGPVIADIARQVAEGQRSGKWQWVLDDPDTGLPTATGLTRRRPTAQQQREVETRNPTCVHPGCRMPSTAGDLDHTVPWSEGGPTTTANLAPLCRHHHRIKHEAGWTYRAVANGDFVFTTPLGHTYTTSGRSP